MENYKIYLLRLKNTDDIRYIGRTRESLNLRWSKHKTNAKIDKEKSKYSFRTNWINKHKDEIEIVCIEENIQTKAESCQKEIYYIELYKSLGYNLVNGSNGGEGGCEGYKHTEEAKQKISRGGKGKKKPGVSKYMKNRIVSEETRHKLSETLKIVMKGEGNPMYGKKRPDNIIRNKEKTGWTHTDKSKKKMSEDRKGEKNANYKTGKYIRKEKKGRFSKLNTQQVIEIRKLYNDNNISYSQLSEKYKVTKTCIEYVILRKTWKNV